MFLVSNVAVQASIFTWTGSASTDWFDTNNWSPAGLPGLSDTINISSGSISLTAPVTIGGQLNWSGGSIGGNSLTIATNGSLNLIGGGSVGLYNVVTNFGSINWSNSVTIYVYNNPGNGWSGSFYNGPGALFNIQSDQSMNNQSGNPFFNNAGTISKGANAGTTSINLPFTNNVASGVVTTSKGTINFNGGGDVDGTFSAGSGSAINFNGGTFVYVTPPTINGLGAVAFTGGNLTLATNTIPNLQLNGGTLTLGTNFQGGTITNLSFYGGTLAGASNTVSGLFNTSSSLSGPLTLLNGATMNWTGGNANGALMVNGGATLNWSGGNSSPITVQANGTLNLLGGSSVGIYGSLTNFGTVNWSNSLTLYVYNNPGNGWTGAFFNQPGALLNIQSDQSMNNQAGSAFFTNAGTIIKGANTGTTSINVPFTNSPVSGVVATLKGSINFNGGGDLNGTFNAATNSAINFNGGTFVYSTIPTFNGPGIIEFTGGNLTLVSNNIPNLQLNGGTLTLGANFQGGTITNLSFYGGTLVGASTVSGVFNSSSSLSGPLTLLNGATMNWTGGDAHGMLTVNGGATLNWSAGNASPITVQTNGVLNLLGGNSVGLYGSLTNFGTVNWSNNITLYVYNNPGNGWTGAFYNQPGALLNIQSDQSMNNQAGSAFFSNAGTISKGANAGTTSINVPFTNNPVSGVVTTMKGTINFNGGGDLNGTFNAGTNSAINFNGGTFVYSTIPAFNGPGAISFTGGNLTLISNNIPNLQLNGGTLTLGPNFQGGTITNLSFYGGTLAGAGYTVSGLFNSSSTLAGPLTLLNGATMNWTGGDAHGMLTVNGGATLNWSAGNASPITVQTNGVLNLLGGSSVAIYGALTNFGTVNWSNNLTFYVYNNPGNGWSGAFYNQPGALLNIQSDQGMYNQGGSAFFNNAGTVSKGANTGTTTISVPFTNNAVSGVVITLKGSINFNGGGDLNGTFNAATNSAINFNGGTFVYDTVPTLNGPGTIAFTGGNLTLVSNNIPNLQLSGGTLTLGANFQGGAISNMVFGGVLNGNYTVSGALTLGNGVNGSLNLLSNAMLTWNNGTITGGITVTNGSIINWYNGSLNQALNLVNGSTLNWYGGNASPITVQSNGLLNLLGGGSVALYGSLTNFGTIHWRNSLTFYVYNNVNNGWSGAFYNEPGALLDVQCDQGMYNQGGGAFFVNYGSVIKSNFTGTTTFSVPFTNNAPGVVTASRGTINFNAGGILDGTFNASAGAQINFNGGTFAYDAVPALNGPGNIFFTGGALTLLTNTIPYMQYTGGTLTLGANFQGGVITNLTTGGTLSGNYIVNGSLTLGGGVNGNLNLLSGSTLNWSGGTITSNLTLASGTVVNWTGGSLNTALDIVNGATLNWYGGNASPITVEPNGVMNVLGNGSVALYGVLTNKGTINWSNSPTFYVYNSINNGWFGSLYNAAGGLLNIESDESMNNQGGGAYFVNAGTLIKGAFTGNTTFNVPFTNVAGANINVQSGGINFNGGYVDGNATLSFGLNGAGNYGHIGINGAVTLGGAINLNLNNGYVPPLNGSYSLITYGSESGVFSSTNFPQQGDFWQLNYGATALTASVTNFIAPVISITSPINNTAFPVGANITINANVTDANAPITEVDFFSGTNLIGKSTTSPYFFVMNNVPLGAYAITAKAIDSVGATTVSSPVNVTVYATPGGTNFVWNAGNSGWFTPANWTPNGVPGPLDSVTITNGSTPSLSSNNVSVASVYLSSGTIAGTGTLTVTNTFLWTGGSVSCPLLLTSTAQTDIQGGNVTVASGMTNAGTVNWVSGTLHIYNCVSGSVATINNIAGGVWNIQCDQNVVVDCGGQTYYFQNNGTVQKLAGTGTTAIQIPFYNAGTVTVSSGTMNFTAGGKIEANFNLATNSAINFSGGNFSNALPAVVSGAGTYQFSGGTLTLYNNAIVNLPLVGGTINLGTNFQGGAITNLTLSGATLTGSNNVAGIFNWSGGVVNGTLLVQSNGLLNLSGTANKDLPAAKLLNFGTVAWLGGAIRGGNGTVITNSGQWLVQTDNQINNAFGGATSIFANVGTLSKSATSGVTSFNGVSVLNAGTFDLQSGTINFSSSSSYAQTGATLSFSVPSLDAVPQLQLPGNVSLDGTLSLKLLNAYVPALGTTLTLVTYGNGSGNFANLQLPNLPPGENWNASYGVSSFQLQVTAPGTNNNLQISGTVTDSQNHPVAGATVYAAFAPTSATNLVQNGNFEQPNIGSSQYIIYSVGATNIPGWTIIGPVNANVDVTGYNFAPAEDGNQYFDPTGNTGGAGITQTIPTVPGTAYVLTFYHGTYDQHGILNALGVTLGANTYTFGETEGVHGNLNWTKEQIPFVAVSNATTLSFIEITGFNADDNLVDNVSVLPVGYGQVFEAVTDASGHYQIPVASATWQVGVSGLAAFGYTTPPVQTVAMNGVNQVANFTVQPSSGAQNYTIATSANPAGAGTITGSGSFASGATVTLTATPVTSALPYLFLNWTENGVLQSTNATYSFPAIRNRSLVANFTLPLYTVAASNNPPGAGSVSGTGSFYYGMTNVLTATANFGYTFSNWTEGATVVGNVPTLTTVVSASHSFSANYAAVNLTHVVTTATSPGGLATVAGGGTYNNGQTANFSAPVTVTNAPYIYTFQYYTLSNSVVSYNATFSKTFSTLDQTNLQYVAVYKGVPILPLITAVNANFSSPVPATTNFLLTLQFNRGMNTNISPKVVLTNSAASVQPSISTNGSWTSTSAANDTYNVPPVTFTAGMDGTFQLFVSGALDLNSNVLALTNPTSFVVVVTPPPAPVLAATASNNTSVTVGWSSYVAPTNLASFRVYISTTNFSSAAGASILTGLGASARNFVFSGLSLDTTYYVAVQAVDQAGNGSAISTLAISIPSSLPPPVAIQAPPVGANSVNLTWNSYNTAPLFGFAGFYVYQQPNNFSSVAGLTPIATLPSGARLYQINGLDRSKTYYFAVVGFNGLNAFNPNVTTVSWSDPYAGNISVDTTIGGPNPSTITINQSINVINNATLTIQPGTTLLFAPGTGLTVQSGRLIASGTALAPIILDSANDTPGNTPAPGDWNGVTLGTGAGSSSLQFVEIFYGKGLTLSGCSPTVNALTASFNTPYGLAVGNSASLTTSSALLKGNSVGVEQLGVSSLTIQNSVIKNNGTNALQTAGGAALTATSDWWGTPTQSAIAATLQGNVNVTGFLTSEPLLTPAIGTVNGLSQVYSQVANLQLACRTASAMRISEDNTFNGVFFGPFTNNVTFPLSAGAGLKHIFAQFRSVTGQTNTPVELDLTYIVAGGPVIQSFNLTEGKVLNRPLTVTGSATASLGVQDVEFYLDGVLVGTNAGANLSQFFDIRMLANAVHQVEMIARDTAGNIATLQNNVVIAVTPPVAPVITLPAVDIATNTSIVSFRGTAEPNINIQVSDNGQILLTTNSDANGNFSLTNAVLQEGANAVIAVASDSTGTTVSATRNVTVATIPPAALVMNAPVYNPGNGLTLSWQFPTTGKRATTFQLFWSTLPFASTNQATSHSLVLNNTSYNLQGLNNGTYYFGVVGYDAAGNPSPLSALVSTVYDAAPPTLSISYGAASPVGKGLINIVLTSSKVLSETPSLTFQLKGAASPILLNLTNSALNTYQTAFMVSNTTSSGTVAVMASAQDQVGNVFSGAPTGPALIIDTVAPTGVIATVPVGPVQTTNSTNVSISLTLSKLAGAGTTPTLSYAPPVGSNANVLLSGSGSNWSGTLALTSAMGSGNGTFAMSAQDGLGNIGTQILSGGKLEIYNTSLPSAPATPTNLVAVSLPGGKVKLTWNSVTNAQFYRLYREPGTSFTLPGVLDQDNLTTNVVMDAPPTNGTYSYGVSASRLGSESPISLAVQALSDSTLPLAPTNVTVGLAASGVQITWQEPAGGEAVDHYNIYRNGTLIRAAQTIAPLVDYPPTGTVNYTVGAVDTVGNENISQPASIQLLVGPVKNLSVLVEVGQAVVLNWLDTDVSVVGHNVYRNGIKQNATVLTTPGYTDPLPLSDTVQYAVTAVNATNAESPKRLVSVAPMGFGLLANSAGSGTNNPLLTGYFDQFQVSLTNLASSSNLTLTNLVMQRTVNGLTPLTETQALTGNLGAGSNAQVSLIFPEASIVAPQSLQVTAYQQTDSEGSSVAYQDTFNITSVQQPSAEIAVSVNQLPLAGGLTPFQVQIMNQGYADIQLVVERGGGTQPGDLYISVLNNLGQEVSRTPFQGTPSGTFFLPNGDAYVKIAPGASLSFTVPNVLVPAALAGSSNVTFVAVASAIYNQFNTPNQLVSGPLSGSMVSSGLAQTPYYGTAHTDQPAYDGDQPVIITGQSIDRATGNPVPNTVLNIGFATRGYKWYRQVTTDANGNYQYTYNPSVGFGGSLTIWACNPLVVDQLNQAQINIYRLYSNPATGDVTMSKNGTLDFSIKLINPGDVPLTALNMTFSATQTSGTTQVPAPTITGTNLTANGFSLGPNQTQTINLRLAAAASAPNTAQATFTFTSAEGASVTFTGNLNLLPAVPVLIVQKPAVGYLEVSVNRGAQKSGQITIMNNGLQDLKGVTVTPPTNNWIALNLPVSTDGKIHLPDLGVGQSNTFTVVFNPPAAEPLDFYSDSVVVQGTNFATPFPVNVYALVTSHETGGVQFSVQDILGQQVYQASVRLQNNLIQSSVGPFYTDTNGLVTVTNLQEGDWSWQVAAPGCSAASGVITVVADQTVSVDPILSRSLVTISFTVVPVPFTDVYQIQVEQTFETFVPVPVLVLTPVSQTFHNVQPGFTANFIATAQNQGLIQMENVNIKGSQKSDGASLTPLITYAPVLLPQQTIDVPFIVSYVGTNGQVQQDTPAPIACLPGGGIGDDLEGFFDGLNAIANAEGRCYKSESALVIAGTLAVLLEADKAVQDAIGFVTDLPAAIGGYLGCLLNSIFGLSTPSLPLPTGFYDTTPKTNPNIVNTGPSGCFTGDTRVLMADGTEKAISEIHTNDIVRTGQRTDNVAMVAGFYSLTSPEVRKIQLKGINGQTLPALLTTEEHLIWVDGKGWTAAGLLKPGDWLFNSRNQRVQVSSNDLIKGRREVYTMRLLGDNAFYADDVLVHDMCGPTPPLNEMKTVGVAK